MIALIFLVNGHYRVGFPIPIGYSLKLGDIIKLSQEDHDLLYKRVNEYATLHRIQSIMIQPKHTFMMVETICGGKYKDMYVPYVELSSLGDMEIDNMDVISHFN